MPAGRRVLAVGAEHADQLAHQLGLAELRDGGARRLAGRVLDDREVAVGERGDLGQVGDADDLAAGGEVVTELARMLGAGDDSDGAARRHAEELLRAA